MDELTEAEGKTIKKVVYDFSEVWLIYTDNTYSFLESIVEGCGEEHGHYIRATSITLMSIHNKNHPLIRHGVSSLEEYTQMDAFRQKEYAANRLAMDRANLDVAKREVAKLESMIENNLEAY